MNTVRVQEILNSKGIIDVEYHGKSIWINSLDVKRKTAEVQGVNNESIKLVVDINDLDEPTS